MSEAHFGKVQALIQKGIDEGAKAVAGGVGKPQGFEVGYFVRPTVFAGVNNDMAIAREEVFGPVLVMIPFKDEEEAIQIANDTPYGLAAYLSTGDAERAKRVARRLKAGMVQINGASNPGHAPFGGYKQSGIGREGENGGLKTSLKPSRCLLVKADQVRRTMDCNSNMEYENCWHLQRQFFCC